MEQKHKEKLLARVKKLHTLYKTGKIKTLAKHEVNPGLETSSREQYLYFTLPPCLNFQRNSPAMWASALKTFQDSKTNYLFFPEKVVTKKRATIQADLIKHKLALQQNKHTDIWITISTALHRHYNSDPRELLKTGNYNIPEILTLLQQTQRKDFPYISGPKLSNYWLYILSHFTDAKFKNMQEISIIPDTHVLNCTIHLGMAKPGVSPIEAAKLWKDLLHNSGITPAEMHAVLWNWSRDNFQPAV